MLSWQFCQIPVGPPVWFCVSISCPMHVLAAVLLPKPLSDVTAFTVSPDVGRVSPASAGILWGLSGSLVNHSSWFCSEWSMQGWGHGPCDEFWYVQKWGTGDLGQRRWEKKTKVVGCACRPVSSRREFPFPPCEEQWSGFHSNPTGTYPCFSMPTQLPHAWQLFSVGRIR